jgi:hypothetical protein
LAVTSPSGDRTRLLVAAGAYAALFLAGVAVLGLPTEREVVLAWAAGALVVVSLAGGPFRVGRVLRDWVPFALVLVVYDYSRGWADGAGFPVHWSPQLRADRFLFAGQVPTAWLQDRLIDPDHVAWWEVGVGIVYISHFVVPFAVAVALYLVDRDRWARFARRFVAVSFLGVATFIVFPAAPPWLAARESREAAATAAAVEGWQRIGDEVGTVLRDAIDGLGIDDLGPDGLGPDGLGPDGSGSDVPVSGPRTGERSIGAAPVIERAEDRAAVIDIQRTTVRGWRVVGLDTADKVLSKGQASVNLTAAIPSLHTAYALLVTMALWPLLGRWGRTFAALYPAAMTFTLVVGGEHYVVDVLVGWAYVVVVHLVLDRWEQRGVTDVPTRAFGQPEGDR